MGERDSGIWVPPGGSADPGPEPPAPPQPPPTPADMPSPEELAEQLRQLKASDVVLSLIPTLGQLAYAKLDPAALDVAEARVAIDAIRALLPVIESTVPSDVIRDLQQLVMNLQLAYASAVDRSAPPPTASDNVSQGEASHGVGAETEAAEDERPELERDEQPKDAADRSAGGGPGAE